MKLLIPPIKDCRYIHKKLRLFYDNNEDEEEYPDTTEFDRALKRFCDFYGLEIPEVQWNRRIEMGKVLGQCHTDGKITLLTPYWRKKTVEWGGREDWTITVYHKLGHYVYWANAEEKAEDFSTRMMRKWRK